MTNFNDRGKGLAMSSITRIKCGNGNCFLVCGDGGSILVDTSRFKFRDKILAACGSQNVRLIVLTHGHVDHVQNAAFFSERLNAPIAMHEADYTLTKNNMVQPMAAHKPLGKLILALSRKSFEKDEIPAFEPSFYLREGNSLEAYGVEAETLELPGHTKGSIGLRVGNDLIAGDAMMNFFRPSDSLLYGNEEMAKKSAVRIRGYGGTIYFGHGRPDG